MKTQNKTLNLQGLKIRTILPSTSVQPMNATGGDDDDTTKYGITEKKKSEIDALQFQVIEEQGEVEQLQAIVDSLTQKLSKLNTQLSSAEANKARALSNKNLASEVKNDLDNLIEASTIAIEEVVTSETAITKVTTSINDLTNQLIYSVEVINKLVVLVNKKKQSNPLISDELVDKVNQIGTDANNAIALTMTALKSVFTSQATTTEAESALSLEMIQAAKLYLYVTGVNIMGVEDQTFKNVILSDNDSAQLSEDRLESIEESKDIIDLLYGIYDFSVNQYNDALIASQETTSELGVAQDELSKAQASLASSQAALAAANAAALAS